MIVEIADSNPVGATRVEIKKPRFLLGFLLFSYPKKCST
jgi:hypothetical protein